MGRNLKIFKKPKLLDLFITQELMQEYKLEDIDLINMLDGIILNKYCLGKDKSNDVIDKTHYHLRAETCYTRSGVFVMMKRKSEKLTDFQKNEWFKTSPEGKFLKLTNNKSNSRGWSLQVKDLEDGKTIESYYGYAIKDTIISTQGFTDTEVSEMYGSASTLYKFKLDKKREEKKDKNKVIMDYLAEQGNTEFRLICQDIVKYAILNDKKSYLTKNYLKTTARYYMAKNMYMSIEDLTDEILQN